MINWIKQFKKNGQRRSAKENYDERFLNLIAEFDKQRKYIAGVCVGALPIGKSGVLAGRNAVFYWIADYRRLRVIAHILVFYKRNDQRRINMLMAEPRVQEQLENTSMMILMMQLN